MNLYTDADVQAAHEPILANFHPPTTLKPSWHIRPDEMARAVLDAVAPAIAARALRNLADAMDRDEAGGIDDWGIRNVYAVTLRTHADEIEAGQS